MVRSLLIAFTIAGALATSAVCISAARAQAVVYCYTDPFSGSVVCFNTLEACQRAAVVIPNAYCRAR